jgi:hypothetical protein
VRSVRREPRGPQTDEDTLYGTMAVALELETHGDEITTKHSCAITIVFGCDWSDWLTMGMMNSLAIVGRFGEVD